MLVNLCYNPSRSNFIDFLEQLTLNIDNAFSVSNKITLLGDYNINYLDSKEKENLDSIIIPYGLKVFCPNDETRISSCNIRLLQSHMRLKKNRPYNHWLKSQGHYLLCFSTSNQSEPIRFACDMRLRPVTCDIRPEWPKCNLCRIRNFSSKPSGLVVFKN